MIWLITYVSIGCVLLGGFCSFINESLLLGVISGFLFFFVFYNSTRIVAVAYVQSVQMSCLRLVELTEFRLRTVSEIFEIYNRTITIMSDCLFVYGLVGFLNRSSQGVDFSNIPNFKRLGYRVGRVQQMWSSRQRVWLEFEIGNQLKLVGLMYRWFRFLKK